MRGRSCDEPCGYVVRTGNRMGFSCRRSRGRPQVRRYAPLRLFAPAVTSPSPAVGCAVDADMHRGMRHVGPPPRLPLSIVPPIPVAGFFHVLTWNYTLTQTHTHARTHCIQWKCVLVNSVLADAVYGSSLLLHQPSVLPSRHPPPPLSSSPTSTRAPSRVASHHARTTPLPPLAHCEV